MGSRTIVSLLGAAFLASAGARAGAATIFVGPACTPVQAVASANSDSPVGGCAAGSGDDTIVLEPGAVYTLNAVDNDEPSGSGPNGLPVVTSVITILGNGATIERDSAAPDFRFFEVTGVFFGQALLRLEDLTLRGGRIQSGYPHTGFCAGGGGVRVDTGSLELDHVALTDNEVYLGTGCAFGGGALLAIGAFATVADSSFTNNVSELDGGGIRAFSVTLSLQSTIVDGNGGGGIAVNGSQLDIRRSVISRNVGGISGGLFVTGESPSRIANTTLSSNHATGVDPSTGEVAAGGLWTNSTNLVVANVTIAGNRGDGAVAAGGLFAKDPTILANVVVAGNTVDGDGAHSSADCLEEVPGNITAASHHNLYGLGTGCPQGGATDVFVAPAAVFTTVLGPLALNPPGPTETHALLAGSPALDAADAAVCAADPVSGVDQRGVARPAGAGCDIGAFEGAAPPANDPPVAADDNYATAEDVDLVVSAAAGVLANDFDPDGDPITAVLQTAPASGALALNPDGSFTYTPNANFNGNDAFTYRARDAGGTLSNLATVTLTVTAVNDPPVAANETYGVAKNTTLNVAAPGVLDNDTDIDSPALTAVLVSGPANGTLVLNPDGSFTYTPANNFVGTVSFAYEANDGLVSSNTATVNLAVAGFIMAPIAGITTSIPGGTGTFTGFPEGAGACGSGAVAFLGTGSGGQQGLYARWSDGPQPIRMADLATPIPGGSGSFTDLRDLRFSALPGDPCRDAAAIGAGPGGQKGAYLFTACEVGAPSLPALRLADLTTLIPGGAGTFTGVSDLALRATPGDPCRKAAFVGLGVGQIGVYVASACRTGQPEPPPIRIADLSTAIPGGSGAFTALRGPSLTFQPGDPCHEAAFVGDGDGGQQGIYAASFGDTSCSSALIALADLSTPIPGGSGAFTALREPSLTFQPGDPCRHADFIGDGANGQQGIYAMAYGNESCAGPAVTVADRTTAIPQGQGTFASFLAVSASKGHTAFLATGSGGQKGIYLASTLTKVVDLSDTIEGKSLADLRLGPDALAGSQLVFAARFTDGSEGLFRVTVDFPDVNDAPVASPDGYAVDQDETLTVAAPGVLANDMDVEGDSLAASLVTGPASGSLTLNPDGSFTYTPNAGFVGTDTFTYQASDGQAASGPATVIIVVQAASGPTWSPTGSLNVARTAHTATLLPNGRVLVAGGYGPSGLLKSAELYEPATGTWGATGTLQAARTAHTAVLLPNGKVLVTGGIGTSGLLKSAELYNPATGMWSTTGNLKAARAGHTAEVLANGKVLVVGGLGNSGILKSAELYNPATGTWSATGNLSVARTSHSGTLLSDGKLLVAGGLGNSGFLQSAELYNPATGTWSATGNLGVASALHTATRLADGRVLLAGGLGAGGSLARTERYDRSTGTWTPVGGLAAARSLHTATRLPDGRVLAAGGFGSNAQSLHAAEVFDPASAQWQPTASLNIARGNHTETLLPSGKVLAAGGGLSGLASAELFAVP